MKTYSKPPFLPSDIKSERPAIHFERAVFAVARHAARQFSDFDKCRTSEDVARRIWPKDDVTPLLLTRAATSLATTTTTGWAAEFARAAVGDFIKSLAPQSAAARLIKAGLQTSLAGINSIHIPRRQGLPANDVAWAGEGAPIPARAFNLTTAEFGPARKLRPFARCRARLSSSPQAKPLSQHSYAKTWPPAWTHPCSALLRRVQSDRQVC